MSLDHLFCEPDDPMSYNLSKSARIHNPILNLEMRFAPSQSVNTDERSIEMLSITYLMKADKEAHIARFLAKTPLPQNEQGREGRFLGRYRHLHVALATPRLADSTSRPDSSGTAP